MNTIEEAAKSYQPIRDYSFSQTDSDVQRAFIEGVYWQQEQSENEILKLLDWIVENDWSTSNPIWVNGETSLDCDGGKGTYTELTSKELYEVWKKTI